METFLDEFCLKSRKPVTDGDFEITFNYSFLAPPVRSFLLLCKNAKWAVISRHPVLRNKELYLLSKKLFRM
jgi:hypothetical protein